MKRPIELKFVSMLLFIVATALPLLVFAQDPGDNPDNPVPFDGGLSLVIAAGAGYAIKKARDKRKKATMRNSIKD
jgi:hypothetical protein